MATFPQMFSYPIDENTISRNSLWDPEGGVSTEPDPTWPRDGGWLLGAPSYYSVVRSINNQKEGWPVSIHDGYVMRLSGSTLVPVHPFMHKIDNIEVICPAPANLGYQVLYFNGFPFSTDGIVHKVSYPAFIGCATAVDITKGAYQSIINCDVSGKSVIRVKSRIYCESWHDSSNINKTSTTMTRGEMYYAVGTFNNQYHIITAKNVSKSNIPVQINHERLDVEGSLIQGLVVKYIPSSYLGDDSIYPLPILDDSYIKNSKIVGSSSSYQASRFGVAKIVNSLINFSYPCFLDILRLSGFEGNLEVRIAIDKYWNLTLINMELPIFTVDLHYAPLLILPQVVTCELTIDCRETRLVRANALYVHVYIHNALQGKVYFVNCTFEDNDALRFNINIGYTSAPSTDLIDAKDVIFKDIHFDPAEPTQSAFWFGTTYTYPLVNSAEGSVDLSKYNIPTNKLNDNEGKTPQREKGDGEPLHVFIEAENDYSKLFSSGSSGSSGVSNKAIYLEYSGEVNTDFPVTGTPYQNIV